MILNTKHVYAAVIFYSLYLELIYPVYVLTR